MSLFCPSSPPAAPDYVGAAKEQGQANLASAQASSKLNNPNVISPYGTQKVTYGDPTAFDQPGWDAAIADYKDRYGTWQNSGQLDESGKVIPGTGGNAPVMPDRSTFAGGDKNIPTMTQTFSPEQQALYDKSVKTKGLIGDLGIQGATALQGVIGKGVDYSGMPATPGNYDTTRKSVIDAMMGRANQDYTKQSDQMNSDLIASGIRPGTKAYDNAQQMIERSRNDARNQAEISGGNAASQAYGVDSARRQSAITEMLAQRQVPLNEITALMSGSQVSNPFQMAGYNAGSNVAPAPTYGAANAAGQYGTDVYNAQVGQGNATVGAAGTIAAGYFI